MTLPAALQARLAKRGIIKDNQSDQHGNRTDNNVSNAKSKTNNDDEEIIAESYDDPNEQNNIANTINQVQFDSGIEIEEVINCPNASNPYHECTEYCRKHYGLKKFQPNPVMERRRIRMLKIYPLPANWKEIPDINTNRYYYWNYETDEVSWLSPTHPKAEITRKSAIIKRAKLSEDDKIIKKDNEKEAEYDNEEQEEDGEDDDDDDNDDDDEDNDEEQDENENDGEEEPIDDYSKTSKSTRFQEDLEEFLSTYTTDTSDSDKKKSLTQSKRSSKRGDSDKLDPMDPAAYSDIPRGKWSAGLNEKGKAADATASGPLFQMRPYPSPGQILKMNSESKKK